MNNKRLTDKNTKPYNFIKHYHKGAKMAQKENYSLFTDL